MQRQTGVLFVVKQNADVLFGGTGRAGRRAPAGAPSRKAAGGGGMVDRVHAGARHVVRAEFSEGVTTTGGKARLAADSSPRCTRAAAPEILPPPRYISQNPNSLPRS